MKKLLILALIFIAFDASAQRSRNRYKRYYNESGNFYAAKTLVKDRHYTSPNSQYYYVFQGDGNLVVYRTAGPQALWSSGTQGRATTAVFQNDGNLVLRDANGGLVWDAFALAHITGKGTAETTPQTPGYGKNRILMQDDGNLVIYAANSSTARWHTGTNQQ